MDKLEYLTLVATFHERLNVFYYTELLLLVALGFAYFRTCRHIQWFSNPPGWLWRRALAVYVVPTLVLLALLYVNIDAGQGLLNVTIGEWGFGRGETLVLIVLKTNWIFFAQFIGIVFAALWSLVGVTIFYRRYLEK